MLTGFDNVPRRRRNRSWSSTQGELQRVADDLLHFIPFACWLFCPEHGLSIHPILFVNELNALSVRRSGCWELSQMQGDSGSGNEGEGKAKAYGATSQTPTTVWRTIRQHRDRAKDRRICGALKKSVLGRIRPFSALHSQHRCVEILRSGNRRCHWNKRFLNVDGNTCFWLFTSQEKTNWMRLGVLHDAKWTKSITFFNWKIQ